MPISSSLWLKCKREPSRCEGLSRDEVCRLLPQPLTLTIFLSSVVHAPVGDSALSLSDYDQITDFAIGVDRLQGLSSIGSKVTNFGVASSLTEADIASVLTSGNFASNAAATFTVGIGNVARTFVAMNDTRSRFQASSDLIIEITGYTGLLSALTIA